MAVLLVFSFPFIMHLCCCCIPVFLPFFAVYLPHKCTFTTPFLQLSWKAAEFSPVKYLTLLFQLIIHWVLWKLLQWLPSQERKMGGFLMYPTELFWWRGNMELMHTPMWCSIPVCAQAMKEAVSGVSSWEHSGCTQGPPTAGWGLSQVPAPTGDIKLLLILGEKCVFGCLLVCFKNFSSN